FEALLRVTTLELSKRSFGTCVPKRSLGKLSKRKHVDRRVVPLVLPFLVHRPAVAVAAAVRSGDGKPLSVGMPGQAVTVLHLLVGEQRRLLLRLQVDELTRSGRAIGHGGKKAVIVELKVRDVAVVLRSQVVLLFLFTGCQVKEQDGGNADDRAAIHRSGAAGRQSLALLVE